jgi:hypothetical protein
MGWKRRKAGVLQLGLAEGGGLLFFCFVVPTKRTWIFGQKEGIA